MTDQLTSLLKTKTEDCSLCSERSESAQLIARVAELATSTMETDSAIELIISEAFEPLGLHAGRLIHVVNGEPDTHTPCHGWKPRSNRPPIYDMIIHELEEPRYAENRLRSVRQWLPVAVPFDSGGVAGAPLLVVAVLPIGQGDVVGYLLELLIDDSITTNSQRWNQLNFVAAQIGAVLNRHRLESLLQHAQQRIAQMEKHSTVGILASGVAHEFNNYVHVIEGYARMAADGMAPESSCLEDLNQILQMAEQAKSLSRRVLDLGRTQKSPREVANLAAAIPAMLQLLRGVIPSQINLSFEARQNELNVLIDRSLFQQMLINLCLNARDAMPNGGKLQIVVDELTVDANNQSSWPKLSPGRYLQMDVTDSGCGMSAETQKRIFEPFFTTKAAGKGTGIGMVTILDAVKQHDGQLKVDSSLNQGTTISVCMPLSKTESQAKPKVAAQPKQGTILVVDDDPMVRKLSARALTGAGFAVTEACDGQDAVDIFYKSGQKFDLIVLDMVMPRLSGREVYARIRETHTSLPVIFCTGFDPDRQAGGDEKQLNILRKPFPYTKLVELVKYRLQHSTNG